MCGCVTLDPRSAYIGFYATAPELHGKGIGIKTWKAVMNYIGPDKNIGLCAAPAQIRLYREKAGFVHPDPFCMICTESDKLDLKQLCFHTPDNVLIREFNDSLLDAVIEYDEQLIRLNRRRLIELGIREDKTLSLVASEVESGKVVGYGCLKWSNVNKAMLGPLYADNAKVAEALLFRLLSDYQYADVQATGLVWLLLDGNKTAIELGTRLGQKFSYPSPRLFTKYVPQPTVDASKVYALFSPDIAPY